MLKSYFKDRDVLCFTEHWLRKEYLHLIYIDNHELVSYFRRDQHNHGGSCIYVRKNISIKNINCIQNVSVEKDFEVSGIELVDYDYIIVCIYKVPDFKFWTFLKTLN